MGAGQRVAWWLFGDGDATRSADRRELVRRLDAGLATVCGSLVDHSVGLAEAVADRYRGQRDALAAAATDPATVGLADPLRDLLVEALEDLVEVVAAAETRRLAEALDAELPTGTSSLADDVADTFAARYARRAIEWQAVDYEAAAVARLGRDAVRGRPTERVVNDVVESHPPIVARAAALTAARYGVQAVAERLAVVDRKRWVVPDVGCRFHGRMDGRTAPVDRSFTVVGGLARTPRSAFVAGEDRHAGCPCVQRALLADVETGDPRALATNDGVTVAVDGEAVTPLSEREFEVYCEHARAGETFLDFLERVHDEQSVRGGARALGVAKKTLYRWFDRYVDGFDRYNGP